MVESKEVIKQIFSLYLERKGHRKTPERFAILEEIYSHNDHLDVDTICELMKNKQYSVSKATIYNTIELLLECNLVIKHQFGSNVARFEKSMSCMQHDHLICNMCGSVSEFCDPRIQDIQDMVSNIMEFDITSHSLYFYGVCKSCKQKMQKEQGNK